MFVLINNKNKSPIEIEGDIQRTRNNGEITPAFAMEILSLTNFRSNIKKLVRAIKDKNKTKEEILPYKKFIVSCVDSREISEEALADLQEMATLCGCEKEFEVANGKPKFYGKFDCNNTDTKVVKSNEKFKSLKGEDLTVYFDADEVEVRYFDLSKVKALKFKEGARIDLRGDSNLPKGLDVSMCSYVDLRYCDLSGVKKIIFNGKKQEMEFMKNEFMINAKYFEGKFAHEIRKENVCEKKKEKKDNSLFSRIRKRFGAGGMGE
jgi:hypothetical protein